MAPIPGAFVDGVLAARIMTGVDWLIIGTASSPMWIAAILVAICAAIH